MVEGVRVRVAPTNSFKLNFSPWPLHCSELKLLWIYSVFVPANWLKSNFGPWPFNCSELKHLWIYFVFVPANSLKSKFGPWPLTYLLQEFWFHSVLVPAVPHNTKSKPFRLKLSVWFFYHSIIGHFFFVHSCPWFIGCTYTCLDDQVHRKI